MNNEAIKSGYSFKLIQEGAPESDLFPYKTHEAVKNTLFDLIEDSEKGVTIGLEGGWGSGKTAVINFLNEAIKKSKKKTLFFTFDAWAHEGDPLRRIFLESLISEIDPDEKDKDLINLSKEISGRTKTVEVKTKKETSTLATLLSLSALAVPMGAAFLSAIDYGKLLWPLSPKASGVNFPFLFGLIFCGAPLLVLLYWRFFGEKNNKKKIDWSLLVSNSTEDYTQDITEDGERSSIEFESYFQKILMYSVGKEMDKKFERAIIVIDNLDRVDSEHANQLWSTLQTFFQHRSNKKLKGASWRECIWFIVPYDKDGLSKIWESKGDKLRESKDDKLRESKDDDSNTNQSTAQSFLNKCFQIIAEVPAPVMSAWNEYTIQSAKKALTGWPEVDREVAIRTYKRHASRLDISPTPREINNFVNQVGFIGMRWGGIMSPESISLYAILRKKYPEATLRKKLLDESKLPDNFEANGNTQIIKQELAGLLFGVSKDKGVELLLTPEITKSITSGDGEVLKKLIENHVEAFWITWDAIKSGIMPTDSHTEEYRIAATKSIYTGLSEHLSRIKSELTALENTWRNTSNNWKFSTLEYVDSLGIISNVSENKPAFIDWLHKTILEKLSKLIAKIGQPEFADSELIEFANLAKFFTEENKPLTKYQYKNLDSTNWPIWVNHLRDYETSLPNVLPAKGVIEEIGNQYLGSSTTLPEDNLTLLLDTYNIYPATAEWESVITNLITWANRTNRELSNDLAYLLMLNLYIYNKTALKQAIKTCVEGAPFWVRGNLETLETTPTLALLSACVLGSSLQENPYVNSVFKDYWGSEENSIEEVNSAFEILNEAKQLGALWDIAKDQANLFSIAILEAKIDSVELYSYKEAILNLESYSEWFDEVKHSKIIHQLCECAAFDKATEIIIKTPEDYDYALYLLQQHGNTKAIDFVNNLLPTMSKEVWDKAFKEDDNLLLCAIDDAVRLDHKYSDALEEFYSKSMKGQNTSEWLWNNFDSLIGKAIDQKILLKKLTSEYFSTDEDKVNDIGFNAISNQIADCVKKVSSPQLMARVCNWLDEKQWSRIQWLIDLKLKIKAAPLESLSSRINEALNDEKNNDKLSTILELAKMFKVEIAPKQESSGTKK